jgi:WD40 repeat protein
MNRASLIGNTPHPDATAAALDAFTRARLLTQQHDTVEITHEALLRAWPRLAEWLTTDRPGLLVHRRLADAAKAWLDVRRDAGSLYRGAQLADVRAWLDGREDRAADLSTAEGEFVTASVAAEEADREFIRRNNRRLRRGIAVLTVLVVVTLIASGLALWQQRVANAQRAQALAQQAIALSREYAAESLSAGSTDPHRSLLLAAAAWQASPTEEARSAILSAQAMPYEGTLGPTDARLWNVALSPDGTIAALATYAGTVTLWDTASHRELARLTGPDGQPDVAFSPNGRIVATANISANANNRVRLWDAHTHQLIRTLPAQALNMRFSPDGNSLITEYGAAIVLWDVAGGRQIRDYTGDDIGIGVAISHDGSMVAAGDSDGTIHLWQAATGEPIAVLSGHTKTVTSVDFSPNDALLASSGADGTVRLWNVAQRRAAAVLGSTTSGEYIKQVAFSPDGSYVAAAMNAARTVQLWRVSDGASLGGFVGHTLGVASIAFSRDGHTLLSGSLDQTGILWRVQSTVLFQPDPVVAVAFSPDGHLLASSSGQTTTLWDVGRRDPVRVLTDAGSLGQSLSFSPDGKTIAVVDNRGTVRLWDVATGKSTGAFTFEPGLVGGYVTFSPDGRILVAMGGLPFNQITSNVFNVPHVYEVRQWDVATGKVLVTTSYHVTNVTTDPYPVGQTVFSPNGDVLAVPLTTGSIELRQARTGTRLGVLAAHQDFVTTVAFNQDGTILATGGGDRTVELWNTTTRQQIGTRLVGHNGVIKGIAFLPGGHTLATVSDDDPAVRLWDVASHAPLAAIQGSGSFNGMAVQPGTGLIATAGTNDTVALWNPDPARVLSTICAALRGTRPITTAWQAISSDPSQAPRC